MISSLKKALNLETILGQKRFEQYYQSLLINDSIMFAGLLLQRAARKFPSNHALICKDDAITYEALYHRSITITKRLQQMGVKPRDRVCLLFENSIEFYIAYYGIWQTGAVVVPLNTFLHEKELEYILKDAQPRAMIISQVLSEKLKNISPEQMPNVIHENELQTLIASAQPDDIDIPCLAQDEMAALLYTSGTTGIPKGVMLSSKNILTNVVQGISLLDVTPADRVYGVLPLFHSFAQSSCVWGSFFLGGTTIVIPKIERKWLLDGLKHKPTIVLGVPALYALFCLMKTVPLDDVRYFVCGGDALPDKIQMGFELIYRRRICNGYGLTETSPLIAANLVDELVASNTVGRVPHGIQCSIRDEEGNEIQKGQIGILWVKGDNIMLGYYNEPKQTQQVLQQGWLNTGDFASIDKKERLIISGRHKDLIANKGFKIYPQEIENILLAHSSVIKAAVVGKKDEEVGEIPIAFVVLKEPVNNIETILKAWCERHLATYKIPRRFVVMEDLPMTALGKIDKKRIRKELLDTLKI